jgi:hypothetical protein
MKTGLCFGAICMVAVMAAPAAAQNSDVRVRVDTEAIREAAEEIRSAMREAFGPDFRLELHRDVRSATRDVAEVIADITRNLSVDLRDFSRDFSRSFGRDFGREIEAWFDDGSGSWQRNFPASQTDTERRTFAIGATGEFELENLSGDIRIVAGSGRDLVIEITRRARGRRDDDARTGLSRVRVETTHRGDRVVARTVYPSGRQSDYSVSVDYVVTAPAGTRVTARTVSGNVTVSGLTGELSLHSTSGDITATDVTRLQMAKTVSGDVIVRNSGSSGLLQAATMSGDVTATDVKADRIDFGSVSGSVTARNVTSGDVSMKSTSGDLLFDGNLAADGRYAFTSHSGTVRLSLDGRTGFSFEASTFSGSVRTDIPLQVTSVGTSRRPNQSLRGTFGDGSARVTATAFSGNVVVTRR